MQLAQDHPHLVETLVLIEPAAGGGFAVPAAEELGRDSSDPRCKRSPRTTSTTAFDLFMRGVCGEDYGAVLDHRLGVAAREQAIRESAFFFRDEVPAVLESTFSPAQAARIRCPVLVAEGEDSAVSGPLSQQITALATGLLPHAAVVRVAGTNHMMPLQDPDSVARLIQDFVSQQS
jgi:pimeloyl-ACP methyl ester carboxylesterase